MIRRIVQANEPSLREISKRIEKIDKKITDLIRDLKETLIIQKDPEGVGLAAPQVGKNIRMFAMRPDENKDPVVIINPEIVSISKPKKTDKKTKILEGCLSLPNYYGPLVRAQKITIRFWGENGETKTQTFTGLAAQIVQHEIDHLEGTLFVDRLLEQKKPLYELVNDEWEKVEI